MSSYSAWRAGKRAEVNETSPKDPQTEVAEAKVLSQPMVSKRWPQQNRLGSGWGLGQSPKKPRPDVLQQL